MATSNTVTSGYLDSSSFVNINQYLVGKRYVRIVGIRSYLTIRSTASDNSIKRVASMKKKQRVSIETKKKVQGKKEVQQSASLYSAVEDRNAR
jgi:hypothetical protein